MDVIERLGEAEGRYLGSGADREGTDIRAELVIERAVDGAGISLAYTARDDRDWIQREEQMLVGYTRDGTLYLWGLDSATERIRQHPLLEATEVERGVRLRFGTRGPEDERHFREEITFEFRGDDLTLKFARGRPGEALEIDSTVQLVPEAFYSLREESETEAIAFREFDEPPDADLRRALEETAVRLFGSDADTELDGVLQADGRDMHLAVALLDEAVVGFRLARAESEERLVLARSGVLPEVRDHEVATELIVRQRRWARRNGYRTIRAEIPTDEQWRLIPLLEEGFEIVGTYRDSGSLRLAILDLQVGDNG